VIVAAFAAAVAAPLISVAPAQAVVVAARVHDELMPEDCSMTTEETHEEAH
jgi:hypothetical protein